jgi:hypothetical protein
LIITPSPTSKLEVFRLIGQLLRIGLCLTLLYLLASSPDLAFEIQVMLHSILDCCSTAWADSGGFDIGALVVMIYEQNL